MNSELDKLLKQRALLDEKIKKKKEALSEEARKAETHAKVVIGGMVLSHFNCAWNEVDFEALAKYFEKYAYAYTRCTCDPLELKDAKSRLRNWEIKKNPWNSWQKKPGKETAAAEKEQAAEPQQPAVNADQWTSAI